MTNQHFGYVQGTLQSDSLPVHLCLESCADGLHKVSVRTTASGTTQIICHKLSSTLLGAPAPHLLVRLVNVTNAGYQKSS